MNRCCEEWKDMLIGNNDYVYVGDSPVPQRGFRWEQRKINYCPECGESLKDKGVKKLSINRDYIKQVLWKRDFSKNLHNSIVEQGIAPHCYDEYMGKPIESDIFYKENLMFKTTIFRSVVNLLVAYMMSHVYDKCIDEIIDIISKEEASEL